MTSGDACRPLLRVPRAPSGQIPTLAAREGGARRVLIATDGVFSMDGMVAPLPQICDLADKYEAQVMVDDSHATGVVGPTGRGTAEHHGVQGRIDITTSTLGKAVGGTAGGFTSSTKEIVSLLRNRSRPYLFSNTMPPPIAAHDFDQIDRTIAAFAEIGKKHGVIG